MDSDYAAFLRILLIPLTIRVRPFTSIKSTIQFHAAFYFGTLTKESVSF